MKRWLARTMGWGHVGLARWHTLRAAWWARRGGGHDHRHPTGRGPDRGGVSISETGFPRMRGERPGSSCVNAA